MTKLINLVLKLIGAWKWWTILGAVIAVLVAANVWQYNRGQALELKLQTCSDEQEDLRKELKRQSNLTSSQTRLGGQALSATEKECLDAIRQAYDDGRRGIPVDGVRASAAERQWAGAFARSVPAKRAGPPGG